MTERQNLRAANASVQVLARGAHVVQRWRHSCLISKPSITPSIPVWAGEVQVGLCFKLRPLVLLLWMGRQLAAWQRCPGTGPGHLRPSLWELVMLGRKGKHPVSGKLLLASCEPRLTHDSWGQVHTPDLKPNSPEPFPCSRPTAPAITLPLFFPQAPLLAPARPGSAGGPPVLIHL